METQINQNKTCYNSALEYLYSQLPMFSRSGGPAYKPGLDTSIALSKYFGDPQKKFKSIHIGGTNGKGSTSHMLASVLQSQGYKVGLYTSPHLVDFRERMRINGQKIPEEKVVEFVETWKKTGYNGTPSFFELTMIMAFNWFAEENVDFAVIEVGMGGRLDSTNIICPILSVITNISHDHNQFLGESLPEIAKEKAGIIKKGIPVVIGETQEESENIFIERAKELQTEINFADKEINGLKAERNDKGWECGWGDLSFQLPLGGDYQKKNVSTVLFSLQKLRDLGVKIDDKALIDGIENVCQNTGLEGRWMVLSQKPLTIADTGHNIAGISYNMAQLQQLKSERKDSQLRIIIGFVADKAIDKILQLLPHDALYYVTNAQIPRALPANTLYEKFKSEGFRCQKFDSVKEAYNKAKEEASEQDIIFIGGSTFIVADFLSELQI